MTLCCRCNAGGKCRNCVCVKSKRQCKNCLPSRKGCCSNMKLSPASRDATHVSPAPSHPSQPSPSRINPFPSEVTRTTSTGNDAATPQAPDSAYPPISAHPASPDPAQPPPPPVLSRLPPPCPTQSLCGVDTIRPP